MESFGFIYLWFDRDTKKYYLGSHYGTKDDGYICSSKWMKAAFKKRPNSFTRRILENIQFDDKSLILEREQLWLNLIRDEELSQRYYNHKKIAKGGSVKGHKKIKTIPAWNRGITQEMRDLKKHGLLCFLNDRPKAKIAYIRPKKTKICEQCSASFFAKDNRRKYCSRVCSSKRPMSLSDEQKLKISETMQGKVPWNKGIPCPSGALNGKIGAEKMRERATGRRRLYRLDGSWTWEYPNG